MMGEQVAIRLRESLGRDLRSGTLRPRAHYEALFPGHEALVAHEFEQISRISLSPPSTLSGLLGHAFAPASSGSPEPAGAPPTPTPAPPKVLEQLASGARLGFRYQSEIARGGQARVVAVRDETLRRDLAMKIALEPQGGTPAERAAVLTRLVGEARITAQLDHPGVVPVQEMGVDVEGHAFFTMKRVRGVTLDVICQRAWAGEGGWSTNRVLQVILRVAETLAYAHAKGIIHRDIKPANVMVGDYGEVYVMDWGLARVRPEREAAADIAIDPHIAVSDSMAPTTRLTQLGSVLGTPQYMPPEQASGYSVDERADVYAIGALLYHLLAGHAPYALLGTLDSPASVLRAVRGGPPTPLPSRSAPPELRAILDKAMARDPALRYPDAGALGEDLRRFLEGRAVAAYRTGRAVDFRKWVGRNRGLAASLAGVLCVLVAGLIVSTSLYRTADQAHGEAETARERADRDRITAERQAYRAGIWGADLALRDHKLDLAAMLLDRIPSHLRGWDWAYLHANLDQSQFEVAGYCMKFEPHSERVLLFSGHDLLAVDPHTSETQRMFTMVGTGRALSADGRYVVSRIATDDGGIHSVHEVATGRTLFELPVSSDWSSVYFSTGAPLVAMCDGKDVIVFDPETAQVRARRPMQATVIAFSPGLVAAQQGVVTLLLDSATLETRARLEGHRGDVWNAAFAPDGRTIATTSFDGSVRLWDTQTGAPTRWQQAHPHQTEGVAVAFSPGGELLATAGRDGTIYLLDAATGRKAHELRGCGATVQGLLFSDDGRFLISQEAEGGAARVRLWPADGAPYVRDAHHAYAYAVDVSPSGTRLITAGWDGIRHRRGCLKLWDRASLECIASWGSADELAVWAGFSPDGRTFAACVARREQEFLDGELRVWDAETGALLGTRAGKRYGRAAYAPDGRRIALDTGAGSIEVLALDTLKPLATLPALRAPDGQLTALGWSPDGRWLATTVADGVVRVCDGSTYAAAHEIETGAGHIWDLAFRADSSVLALACQDGSARVYEVPTWRALPALGKGRQVLSVAFSADGSRVVTAGRGRIVGVWEVDTGTLLLQLPGHEQYVSCMAFGVNSDTLYSASGDGTIRAWSGQSIREHLLARKHRRVLIEEVQKHLERRQSGAVDQGTALRNLLRDAALTAAQREVAGQLLLGSVLGER